MNCLWQHTENRPSFPSLEKDLKTDVLIIGGGIVGILTAFFLHQKGVPYVLVEKDRICHGTTGYTTAKITFQHGLIYSKLLNSCGIEKTKLYLQANQRAFDKYKELCRNIDCDYEIRDNFVFSLDDRKKLEDEMTALSKIGYDAKLFDSVPLPVNTVGAVCFREQAQFHPLKFLFEISKNLNIFENSFVRETAENIAVTDKCKITANKIIAATHFPLLNKHGSYFIKLYQHRSYVIALENAQNVNGMYVDENKKGLSFRNHGDLLLLGGGSHRTGKDGGNFAEIREFSKKNYPSADEKYFWATQDCMSLDSVPYIGSYSKNTKDLFVASGFNKWGMTGAMTAAMLLSDKVCGAHNEYSTVFDPSRSILKPQLLINGFETTKNLLTLSEKRCPHLGCALKWNSAEHSWDCPCHGSRFDKDGKLLNNPANGDIEP